MTIIKKLIVFTLILYSFSSIEAQTPDYFEFQVQDPSAIQLIDEELGKLYNKHWYLTDQIETRMGMKKKHNASTVDEVFFSWNGKANNKSDFRIILNKYVLFEKESQCRTCLHGLFSITQYNDSILILTKHFRSDYKWFITYTYMDSKHYEIDKKNKEQVYKLEMEADKLFVLREDSIRSQKNVTWIHFEQTKRDSIQKAQEKISILSMPGKYKSDKRVKDVNSKFVIEGDGFWDLYLTEQKYYSRTSMFQQFLKNGGYTP